MPHTMLIDRIICLFQFHKRPGYIFSICKIQLSHTCLTANTWSMHPRPRLNPRCSTPIAYSVPSQTRLISSWSNNLPTNSTNSYLLSCYIHMSPSPLYRGTIHAPRQSIGITPKSKLKFNSQTSHSITAIPPFFKHFTGNPSSPGALPDSFHSLPPLLPLTILLLFHSNLPTPVSANCQLHWYLPPRHLPSYSVHLWEILCPPPHHNTITQYFNIHIHYHLIPCLLTFLHSLYLFPKHLFVTLEIILQSLSPSPIRHSFCNVS